MLRLYRGLLYLYPSNYRQEFGAEMTAVFVQAQRDAQDAPFATRTFFASVRSLGSCQVLCAAISAGSSVSMTGFHSGDSICIPNFVFPVRRCF